MPISERKRTDYRLTLDLLKLILKLAKMLGIGRAHVIELAVREFADKRGVK